VKKNVEAGFFDDFPADIIKQYKLKTTRKARRGGRRKAIHDSDRTPPDEPSVQEQPEVQQKMPEPIVREPKFIRYFIQTPQLLKDCEQSKLAATH